MLFIEHNKSNLPTIILLHGGGLSSWALTGIVELLQTDYHVATPIIDGHGEDGGTDFISIEDSSQKLIEYIDTQCNRKVFALGGLSIGAQIVLETLNQREDIAQFVILESALVLPIIGTKVLTVPAIKLSYGLLKQKWFSKMQAKTLYVAENMLERYYRDSLKISKKSLVNMVLSNGTYRLKINVAKTQAKVLIIAGEKEIGLIKKSAKLLHDKIPNSVLHISPRKKHGELSMSYSTEYVKIMNDFFGDKQM